jgi:NAD(P)-dependent dehydrogenase (short-subunit alcohol dehydrogenase family)
MKFRDKIIVVTGAGSGLGQAVAVGIAREGGSVLLVDINEEGLLATERAIADSGGQAKIMTIDLSTREACQAVVDAAISQWSRLDVLCNIAGVVRMSEVSKVTEKDWQSLVSTNMAAPFWLSQAAIPHLLETSGNIVNCLSQSAHKGAAYVVPYSMTKAAVLMMTKSMAMEFINEPIRINAVSPGSMETGMSSLQLPEGMDLSLLARYSGLRGPADPADVASVVLFLASEEARVVHGAIFCADDGTTAD